MNYTISSIRVKSEWFEYYPRKKNIYQKITYQGFNLYLQLFKFRIHGQENDRTFITSLSLLRKETGYSTQEVFELLKKLKSAKIINLQNVSRWDYLIDSNGKLLDNHILIITENEGIPLYNYETETDDRFIYISLNLFNLYKEMGLNERYYPLYCIIRKWSNNLEHKCWMGIDKMASILEFDKNTIHKMIYTMNKHYLLCSTLRKKKDSDQYFFEHVICDDISKYKKFKETYKKQCDQLLKRKIKVNMCIDG